MSTEMEVVNRTERVMGLLAPISPAMDADETLARMRDALVSLELAIVAAESR